MAVRAAVSSYAPPLLLTFEGQTTTALTAIITLLAGSVWSLLRHQREAIHFPVKMLWHTDMAAALLSMSNVVLTERNCAFTSPWATTERAPTATPRSSLGATGTAHLVDAAGDPATVLNAMKRAGTIDGAQLAGIMELLRSSSAPSISSEMTK